jgi:hypothetical protein
MSSSPTSRSLIPPNLNDFRTQSTQSEESTSSGEYLTDAENTTNQVAQEPLRNIATIGTEGNYGPHTVTKEYKSAKDRYLEVKILSNLCGLHHPLVALNRHFKMSRIETFTTQDLQSYINERSLGFTQLQSMGGQMADILRNLHEKGHVHTQVNPLNIGIQPPHCFELLNFEHSTEIGGLPRHFNFSGTEHPSLMLGDNAAPHHDVFGLGMTFYGVLTNKPLVELSEDNIRKVLGAHPVFGVIRDEKKKDNLMKVFLLLHAYQLSFGEIPHSLFQSIYENSKFFSSFELDCILKKTDSGNYKLRDLQADIEFADWEREISSKLDQSKADELIRLIKNSCSFNERESIRDLLEKPFLADIISDDNINKVIEAYNIDDESRIWMAKTFLLLHACEKYLGSIPSGVFRAFSEDTIFPKELFWCFFTKNSRGKYKLNKLSSSITLPEKGAESIETFKTEILDIKSHPTANDLAKDSFFRNGVISFTLAFTENLEEYSDQGNRLVIYDENDLENFVAIDLEGDVYRKGLRIGANGTNFKYQIFRIDNREILKEGDLNIGNSGTIRI